MRESAAMIDRRRFAYLVTSGVLAFSRIGREAAFAAAPPLARVICDNDFSGDPDGLFQLAQHLLSPSIEMELIVGSHLGGSSGWGGSNSATDSADVARELLRVMHREQTIRVVAGAQSAMSDREDRKVSPATQAITAEAMREGVAGPLVYCAGASLTELALAWLAEPRIGRRLKLVWIGGNEHPGLAHPPPDADALEFNFGLDLIAAQIVFNESDIEVWQVPRDAYRQMLVSYAELADLAAEGPLGHFLWSRIDGISEKIARLRPGANLPRSETYVFGDSPLVTLTALESFFQPDTSSSDYEILPTPHLLPTGEYKANPAGRPMRIYTRIDTRLTFGDMFAKFRAEDRRLVSLAD